MFKLQSSYWMQLKTGPCCTEILGDIKVLHFFLIQEQPNLKEARNSTETKSQSAIMQRSFYTSLTMNILFE